MNTQSLKLFIVAIASSVFISGCGGGGTACVETPARAFTTDQVASLSAAETATLIDQEIINLGENIKLLSNDALSALKHTVVNPNLMCDPHQPQIASITPDQIAVLSPAQVRFIGSAGTGVSKIEFLNNNTFSRLVSDRVQVAAITVNEMATITTDKYLLIGLNLNALNDATIGSLSETFKAATNNGVSQIAAITPAQIATLSIGQVSLLGAASTGIPKVAFLNTLAFAELVKNPLQVAAFTVDEFATLSAEQIVQLGVSFGVLNDSILTSLKTTFVSAATTHESQIAAITPSQIATLTPAKVRILGAYDNGISKINFLSDSTFARLVSDTNQTSQITAQEMSSLYSDKIIGLGVNIANVSNAALAALNFQCNISVSNPQCQVQSLAFMQVQSLTPAQMMVIAGLDSGKGIAHFNTVAFSALNGPQVALLSPLNVSAVTAAQLASLSDQALMGFAPATAASFTAAQKSLLTSDQLSKI